MNGRRRRSFLPAYAFERGSWRVLWWRSVGGFGWPRITRNFYGGGSTVVTAGRLWVQWRMKG